MKKRIKTLFVPYLIMNSFWIFAFGIGQRIPQTQIFFNNPNNIIANFGIIRWFQAYGIGAEYPFLYPLWFVRNLLVLNVFAALIKKAIDAAPRFALFFVCGMFLLLKNFPFNNFCYNLYITDFCMWCFGYFTVKFKWNRNQFDKSKVIAIAYILVLLARTIMKDSNSDLNFLIGRANMVLGILFWYCWFSKSLNKPIQKLLLKYSTFNFGVYLFHEMNLAFCNKLIVRIFGIGLIVQIVQYTMIPAFIIFLTIVFSIFLKKFFPRLLSILTGARV